MIRFTKGPRYLLKVFVLNNFNRYVIFRSMSKEEKRQYAQSKIRAKALKVHFTN